MLVPTPGVRNLIREGKTHQIYSLIQTGGQHGMQTMDAALATLVHGGGRESVVAFERYAVLGMLTTGMLLAYFGPETVLPLTSIVAAAVGVVMMFGRNSLRLGLMFVRRASRFLTKGFKVDGTHASSELGLDYTPASRYITAVVSTSRKPRRTRWSTA